MKIIMIVLIFFLLCVHLNAENPWLGKDKAAHFSYSAFLTYWNYGMSKDFMQYSHRTSLIVSINLTAVLGLSKELSDLKISKSIWSWHDLVYDLAGIGCGLILINNLR